MPNAFLIGNILHIKGHRCAQCFNGFPENCPNPACDGYLHGHQLEVGASIKVELACDLCGKECEKYI